MILNFPELINGFVSPISMDKDHIQQETTQETLSLSEKSQPQIKETDNGGVHNAEETGTMIIKKGPHSFYNPSCCQHHHCQFIPFEAMGFHPKKEMLVQLLVGCVPDPKK